MAEIVKLNEQKLVRYVKQIRAAAKRTVEDMIAIGELMADAKSTVADMGWGWADWLKKNLGWSTDSASNFINLYNARDTLKAETFGMVPLSALYILARPDTPESVRDEVAKRASERRLTHREVREIANSGSGRTAPADGRGRGGGGRPAADTAAAATSPANPVTGTPIPATGQEGVRATNAPSTSIPSAVSSGSPREAADGQGEADKRSAASPAPSQDLARLFDQDLALAEALKLIEKLERANALLQAAVDKSDIEAAQAADASEKRISGLLEKLRERDMRIVELEAQIAAGVDASAAKRLSNQAKLIDELRAGEKEARRQADAARSPGPRGLMVLFQRQSIPDQTEFVRALAAIDDPAPGEQDADKVRWAKLIFRKIHNQQVKRDLLNELAAGELAEVLATHATSITPTSDLKPVDYRRLAEPGALFKKPTNGKSP